MLGSALVDEQAGEGREDGHADGGEEALAPELAAVALDHGERDGVQHGDARRQHDGGQEA